MPKTPEDLERLFKGIAHNKAIELRKKYNATAGYESIEHFAFVVCNEIKFRLASHLEADSEMDLGAAMELAYVFELIKELALIPDKQEPK